jgi:hypothetical protein
MGKPAGAGSCGGRRCVNDLANPTAFFETIEARLLDPSS